MQSSLIIDLLHLYFQKCKCNPSYFVSQFNTSNYIIGFNYDCDQQRFTQVSKSFKSILGYHKKNILSTSTFISKIVHPQYQSTLRAYLKQTSKANGYRSLSSDQKLRNCLKIQAYHINGYWRHFVVYGIDYLNKRVSSINKIGMFVKEKMKGVQDHNQPLKKSDNGDNSNKYSIYNLENFISIREQEVLRLISHGFITKEIADKLNISNTTVESHRKNLLTKLHARNAADLIRIASEKVLLSTV